MTTPPRYILLVDDNLNDVRLISRVLELGPAFPHKVHVAHDGEEALDFLYCRGRFLSRPPSPPLLVLLDLKMPKVDGLEVLRILKSDPVMRRIPVVMLTSSREARDVHLCYELGANAYVVKPVDFNAFKTAVQELGAFWTAINEPLADRLDSDQEPSPAPAPEVESAELQAFAGGGWR